MSVDRTLSLSSARLNDPNAVWRFCNSACVSHNLQERTCDFVRWRESPQMGSCQLRQWNDRETGSTIGKSLDRTSLFTDEVMMLEP